jgi:hypothetical protein
LLALVDEAARDPSGARRLLELASAMVSEEIRAGSDYAMPPGYIYEGAHTWIAPFEQVQPEPLPEAGATVPARDPLTNTANPPQPIEVPFDALIMGVMGWAVPELPEELDTADEVTAGLLLSTDPEGRDLFSVDWNLDGKLYYVTDGRVDLMQPATTVLGTRTRPRALGWVVRRNSRINVRVRNLTNVVAPWPWYEGQEEPYGWPINVSVGFSALNLERP